MTAAAISPSMALSRIGSRELAGWGVAFALIVALHLAIAYAFQVLTASDVEDGGPPPALMIELAPVAFAPPVPEETVAADPVQSEAAESVDDSETISELPPDPVVVPEPVERATADEAATVPAETKADRVEPVGAEALKPETPAETAREVVEAQPVEETAPEVAESVVPSDVVIPIPRARPVQPEAETAERVVEEVAKPVQKKDTKVAKKQEEAKKKASKPSSKPMVAAKTDAKPAEKAAAPKKSDGVTAPRVSPAKWQGQVLAWLRRHQRYPAGPKSKRQEGTVKVAFSIDPSGRVLSARVAGSSGNAELDRAAVDSVRRSSPVPAPPKGLAKQKISLTHSVVFDLK